MKLKKLAMALVTAGIFVGVGIGAEDVKAEVYTYPITQEDPEWSNYNHAELVEMLQIPEDVLASMSNEELVESVLNYPYIMDILFYDRAAMGIEEVAAHFNGLEELLNRQDIGSALIEDYQTVSINQMSAYDPSEDYKEVSKPWITQLLLAHLNAEGKLNTEEQSVLSTVIDEKTNAVEKSGRADDYGLVSPYFIWYDPTELEQHMGVVYTPNGTWVTTIVFEEDPMQSSYYADAAAEYIAGFPGAVIINDATQRYNCHSFAWYSWDAENNYNWINDPSAFWEDGSYTRTTKKVNAIVAYWTGGAILEHSGSVVATGEIMSKWGAMNLVRHDAYNCPYAYSNTVFEYYE